MTKNSPRKAAIRAYMAQHGVNYTTAARALDTSPPSGTAPVVGIDPGVESTGLVVHEPLSLVQQSDALWAQMPAPDPAFAEALRARSARVVEVFEGGPQPDPADLNGALFSLARDELAIAEHTSDPEWPVTPDLVRLALVALATHGFKEGRYYTPATDVCRSALLGREVTPEQDTPTTDAVYPVAPEDLAGTLHDLAGDETALEPHARDAGFHPRHLATIIKRLANALSEPYDPHADVSLSANQRAWMARPKHYLVVEAEPLTDRDRATMSIPEMEDYYADPDRNYSIECPGITAGGCEGWEECSTCMDAELSDEEEEEREETGIAHGVEHQTMWFGWGVATGTCSLHAFSDAWMDSASDLNLPPGRYPVDFDWNETCDLSLVIA